jgi:multiple antibiotic resistance protein
MSEYLLHAFVVLLVVVDPLGNAPVFAALTRHMGAPERRRTALKAVMLAALMLAVFTLFGQPLLELLRIEPEAFQVAGGLLLFAIALDMMLARSDSGLRRTTPQERDEATHRNDISVFPLAFPLLAGPGALASVLLFSAEVEGIAPKLWLLLIIVAVLLAALTALLAAGRVMALLGRTGVNVISRLLGLLLAALAVQYVVDGIRGLFIR